MAREEREKREAEEEEARLKAEAEAKAADKDEQEVQFDDGEDKYQENLFFKLNAPTMGNKDIIESVGLEYEHVSYLDKDKKKKNKS